MAFLRLGRRQRKGAISPYPPAKLDGTQRVQVTHSLINCIILTCREAWPNEGGLPVHRDPGNL